MNKILTKISWLLFCLCVAAVPVAAQDKESILNSMEEIANEYFAAKAVADEALQASRLDEYSALAAVLGGDDPAGLLSSSKTFSIESPGARVAPVAPPSVSSTSQNFVGGGAGTAISDNTGFSVDALVTAAGSVWDVDLNLDITHTFPADLDMTLTSPTGTVVVISTDNGIGFDDVFSGTLFDDQAGFGNEVTDFAYTDGVTATPLIPEGVFNRFFGEDPNGTWTLTIDDDAGGDTGTLNSWSLDMTTLDTAATPGTGAIGASAPAAAINDGLVTSDSLDVSGADPFICAVTLTTDITHTFASDLEINLVSPAGTATTITTDNGDGNDDVFAGTVWTDASDNSVDDFAYADGVLAPDLQPEGAMAAFTGEDPNGTWTLNVGDDADGDTGTLNSWSVEVFTCTQGLPESTPVPTLNAWGIALMALLLLVFGGLLSHRQGLKASR